MRPVALGVALALLAVTVVIVTSVLRRPGETGTPPPAETRLMLAVMPFADLDNRPDRQFFGDGLTEEMITQLGRLQPERLGVIARMSSMQYRGTQKPLDVIGSELGVDYILEGSVRSFGERVRITAQLIQVSDQTHLWAESYDAELGDLLQVQDDVALRVAQALALELLPDQPLAQARAGTRVTAAYEAYLRGRYEWNTFSGDRYPHAIEQFKRAIELDPSYAAAWAGLADTYNLQSFTANVRPLEAYPLAREAAFEALKHDSNSAMAHNSLAFVLLYHDYDLRAADREFRRAIDLAPNYAMAYHWWAGALAALELHDDAIEAIRHAVELDPVELSVLSDMGWYYLFADRWDEGVAECRRILEMQDYGWARACIFEGLIGAGRLADALQLTPYSDPAVAAEFEGQDAESVLRTLRERALEDKLGDELLRERYPLEIALAYAALGDGDGAFEWLDRAYELRDPWLVFLKVDPRFDRISGDPRYDELARRVGLPS
jgi:TolB-like protein